MTRRSTRILVLAGGVAAMALGSVGTAVAKHGADDPPQAPQVQLADGAGHQ